MKSLIKTIPGSARLWAFDCYPGSNYSLIFTNFKTMANHAKFHPSKGDVQFFNGIRFKHTGEYWELDQVIDQVIDKFHTYSGRQGQKHPYNRISATLSLLR